MSSAATGSVIALGIDIGSTNTKVVVVELGGSAPVRELAGRAVTTSDDASSLTRDVMRLIRDVLDSSGAVPAVIGIASMAETGVPLDVHGDPLTGLQRWNRVRARGAAEKIITRMGRSELFAATGVQPGPKAPLAIWAALRQDEPDLWFATDRWAGVADLISLALTGRFTTDHTLAARTMAYRLPKVGEPLPQSFDEDLLDAVGMVSAQLPEVVEPGAIAGRINGSAATATGLRSGTPVVIAGHDHAVGSWAAGVRDPGDAADSVGTAEALIRVVDGSADRAALSGSGISLTRTVTGEWESLISGSASAGSLLRHWLETQWGDGDVGRVLAGIGPLHGEPSGLLLMPYLIGRQTPAPDPTARVRLLDARGHSVEPAGIDKWSLAKAAFEGLALQLRWMDSEQRRMIAAPMHREPMVVFGPGATISELMGIKSAVLGIGVRGVICGEPVATGAALLAAARIEFEDSAAPLPLGPLHSPDDPFQYDEHFENFVAAALRHAPTLTN